LDLPVLDKEASLVRLDGDTDLWNEIREIWMEDIRNLLAAVVTALEARSSDGLRRAAHAIKGASANVGAVRVAAVARDMEHAAPDADWDALGTAMRALSAETESARAALSAQ
jgi:HPt (histidine-containing phosphotransfer) domain-containing protein